MGEGSLIDYGLASADFMSIVERVDLVGDVPWGPHLGLSLRLSQRPKNVRIRSLRAPRLPTINPLVYASKAADRAPYDGISWSEAEQKAAELDGNRARCKSPPRIYKAKCAFPGRRKPVRRAWGAI